MARLQLAQARMAGTSDQLPGKTPLVEILGVGVRFRGGRGREDLQSLAYRIFRRSDRSREIWALKNIDLRISVGEIVGVIGRNGAGKTTLCRVLAGLLRPDCGIISRHCEVSALLALGTGFNAELSGEENVYLNGMMLGYSKKQLDRMLPEITDFSDLGLFIKEPLKRYSSGMRARLGFSIASMLDAEVLVIDETLSVGDLGFQQRAGEKMQRLVNKARSVVVVTHQLDFVEEYCTRSVWLENGAVKSEGTPTDTVAQYRASLPKRTPVQISFTDTRRQLKPRTVISAERLGVRFRVQQSAVARNEPTADGNGGGTFSEHALWALREVNFALQQGEILGVIGRNGAGKTTLCRALTGIIKPDAGRLLVSGRITALLTVGAGFNAQLSGKDNILLGGMMLGMRKRQLRELYPQIVEFAELGDAIDRPVKTFSAGMRTRLGFSILANLNPEVFIIDEALGAGDASFQEKASARLQELIAEADAVIVVTHDMQFVERVCTRALWLDAGRVRADGKPEEVLGAYRQAVQAV